MAVAFSYPILPLDVIELIIAVLSSDGDMTSIKACCLACKCFTSICRKHIFATVKLRQRSPNKLRRLLERNPNIAGSVRELDLVNDIQHERGPQFLHHLRRVRAFTMGFTDYYEPQLLEYKDWAGIRPSFIYSLCHFIQVNDIVDLHLFNIYNVPVTLFTHFPRLSSLDVYNVTVVDQPLSKFFKKPGHAPQLKQLQLKYKGLDMMWTVLHRDGIAQPPILDLSGLEKLSLLTEEDHDSEVISHLFSLSNSLKAVVCGNAMPNLPCIQGMASNITMGSLKTLKSIAIQPLLESQDFDPYGHFTYELEQLSGRNVLEEILIDIDVDTNTRCTTDPEQWAQLDVVLSRGGFPHLRRVHLKVSIWHASPLDVKFKAKLKRISETQFPWLKTNKQVDFDCCVESDWV